jgi:two-component system phosphate regulon sensor histidine kinase PhoR
MKAHLFWKFGFVHLLLLLVVLLAVDTYVVRAMRHEYINAAFAQLEALSHLASSHPPETSDGPVLKEWSSWMAKTGSRVTLVAPDGKVLADSEENPARMETHAGRPEVREALAAGTGRAVRYSATLGNDLVYLATRQQTEDGQPLVMRLSIPLQRLDQALLGFRRRLWTVSFVILILAGGVSLLFFRTISTRIARLKDFSHSVAAGNFRGLPLDRRRDELADLSRTLHQTAAQLESTIRTLTEERNQSAAILASMAEGVAVISPSQKVAYCNAAFCRAVGIDLADWTGRPVVEVVPHSDLLGVIQKARSEKKTVTSELVLGSLRTKTFAVTVAPVLANGTVSGWVLVLHDISELRRLERARRDFVANISHEFKTPLTAIQGFAETLLGGALDDRENSRRFLEIMRENTLRLGRLTDDLLRLSQIEAGKLPLHRQPVAISAVVGPCVETTRLQAGRRGIVLETVYSDNLPLVNGDAEALQQVLQNLLDNAVRYSPDAGLITVQAAARGREMAISVSDRGSGIPKTEQERIFERFYRADTARSRQSGGTGLGLSIAKHLVEAHGGRIQVESELGEGATFTVFLPLCS